LSRPKKRFKLQTTDSNHSLRVYPNLAKNLEVTGINQLWVADITYVRLKRGFIYLAAVLDVCSRRCIGWAVRPCIDANPALDALDKALKARKGADPSGLIHHSDPGMQYASKEYINRLTALGISPSTSRRGNPYDNTYAESFMKTFKYEEVHTQEYLDYDDAYQNIETLIKNIRGSLQYIHINHMNQKIEFQQKRYTTISLLTFAGRLFLRYLFYAGGMHSPVCRNSKIKARNSIQLREQ